MDILSNEELKTLMEERSNFCVSIYMPTQRVGDIQQNRIRLKNLLGSAQDRLIASGLRATQARRMLEPIRSLEAGPLFWQNRSDGLAIFISPGSFHYDHLPLRFEEQTAVADRFLIKPLLPILSGNRYFYILAISQNSVRLFTCTQYSASEVGIEGIIPRSRNEALRFDEYEKHVQFHTSPTVTGGSDGAIVFQGQALRDVAKNNILRYFQQVDRGLRKLLAEEKTPLVFAGVDYLLPIYQEANTYQNLISEGVIGNPEDLSAERLRDLAWNIVLPHFQKTQNDAIIRYGEIAGKGLTSTNIIEIASAAYDGRVAILFLAFGPVEWGTFDPETRTVVLHEKAEPSDQDLMDYAAMHTLKNKGTVYTLPSSQRFDSSPIAAIFRY